MTKLKIVIIFSIVSIMISSCSTLHTKRYTTTIISEDKKIEAESVQLGDWYIDPPGFSSYEMVSDVSTVKHSDTFWLTILAHRKIIDKKPLEDKIEIDSVTIYGIDNELSKKPSRIAPFIDNKGENHCIAFDFFKDQGYKFDRAVGQVTVNFVAKLTDVDGKVKDRKDIEFTMYYQDIATTVPLSGWR